MKRIIIGSFFWLLTGWVYCQKFPIPQQAQAVGVLHSEALNKKINFEKILNGQVFQDLESRITSEIPFFTSFNDAFSNYAANAGISFMPFSFFWVVANSENKATISAYSLKVIDGDKFEKFITESLKIGDGIKSLASHKIYLSDKGLIAWNGSYLILMNSKIEKAPSVELQNEEEQEDPEKNMDDSFERIKKDVQTQKAVEEFMLDLSAKVLDGKELLSSDNFDQFLKKRFDVGFWINNELVFNKNIESNQTIKNLLSTPGFQNLNQSAKGSYQHILANFDNGLIRVSASQNVPSEQIELASQIYDKKIPAANLSFINGSNLLGIGGVSFDIFPLLTHVYRENYETIKPLFQESKTKEQKEFNDIVLDEKKLFSLLGNDATFSVVDFKPIKKTYSEFEYNENDELVEVKKTKIYQKPIVTAVFGVSNQLNMFKVMDYAVSQKWIVKDKRKGFYRFPKSEFLPDLQVDEFVIALLKSQLVISNDASLTKSKFKNSKPLAPSLLDSMTKRNNVYLFFDIQKIIEIVKSGDLNLKQREHMDLIKKNLGNISFQAWFDKSRQQIESNLDIEFRDKNINSFEQLTNLVNELYLRD